DAKLGLVFGMDKALQRNSFYKIELNEKDNSISGLSVVNGNPVVNGKANVALEPGKDYQLKAVINGSVCVVYINDKVALTSRIYALNNNLWGLYARGGVTFSSISMMGN
ncbi:MAG: glycoside hydrolase domain-containing protein, partial [Ferruginibacter sp.]